MPAITVTLLTFRAPVGHLLKDEPSRRAAAAILSFSKKHVAGLFRPEMGQDLLREADSPD